MSGYFRGRLNTARIGLAIGPEFVWKTTFAVVRARSQSVRSGWKRQQNRQNWSKNSRNPSEPVGSQRLEAKFFEPLLAAGAVPGPRT